MLESPIVQRIGSAELSLLHWWLVAITVAVVLILACAGLKRFGVAYSERKMLWIAGTGYWGTLGCAILCVGLHLLVPSSVRPGPAVSPPPVAAPCRVIGDQWTVDGHKPICAP